MFEQLGKLSGTCLGSFGDIFGRFWPLGDVVEGLGDVLGDMSERCLGYFGRCLDSCWEVWKVEKNVRKQSNVCVDVSCREKRLNV